ncbi:hypothetical protein [Porphyromonas endodontalis]
MKKLLYSGIVALGCFLLFSACSRREDVVGPMPIWFKILNLTPENFPTEDIRLQIRNVNSRGYHEFSQYAKGNIISVEMGGEGSRDPMFAIPEGKVRPWLGYVSKFSVDVKFFDKEGTLRGSIRLAAETTKKNYNRIVAVLECSGVELGPYSGDEKYVYALKFPPMKK